MLVRSNTIIITSKTYNKLKGSVIVAKTENVIITNKGTGRNHFQRTRTFNVKCSWNVFASSSIE